MAIWASGRKYAIGRNSRTQHSLIYVFATSLRSDARFTPRLITPSLPLPREGCGPVGDGDVVLLAGDVRHAALECGHKGPFQRNPAGGQAFGQVHRLIAVEQWFVDRNNGVGEEMA